jgi:hypothetical protein
MTCTQTVIGQHMTESGTRTELVAELRRLATGWYFLCKDELSARAEDAANSLEAGACCVQVGHTTYTVGETGDGDHTER